MNICSNELTLNCFRWGKCSWNIFSLIKYYDHPFHMFEFTSICWIFKAIKYHVFIWFLIQWEEEEMTLPRCTCKIFARLLYSECSEIDNARVIWPNERKKNDERALYCICRAMRSALLTWHSPEWTPELLQVVTRGVLLTSLHIKRYSRA